MLSVPTPLSSGTDPDLVAKSVSDTSKSTLRQAVVAGPQSSTDSVDKVVENECYLVQIYPADLIDGMLRLRGDRMIAGRDGVVDLLLEDASISRQHAEFVLQNGSYAIRDLGSTNGTLVNGKRVTDHPLSSGDTIKLGRFIFKFFSAGSIESTYHETVYSIMTRDALTGTMNKRFLTESLRREVTRAIRKMQALSVIMLDIDHFKKINDNHGHMVGDEVLREVGSRLLSSCREDDLVARFGGEEFCVVLCSSELRVAVEVAERVRQSIIQMPFVTNLLPLNLSASFGVACLQLETRETADELLSRADGQLYKAKSMGRNCVVA